MKKLPYILVVALFCIAGTGCEKHSCKDVTCASYQQCGDGQCFCNNGYEGDTCSVLSATKYLGGWTVSENSVGGDPSGLATYYSVRIILDTLNLAINDLTVTPFFGMAPLYIEIVNNGPTNEGTNLYIPPQNVGTVQVSASTGAYYASTVPGGNASIVITLTYTYQGVSSQYIETLRQN